MNRILCLGLCLVFIAKLGAAPTLAWEHDYPKPTASSLLDVAWGTPGFVAVSENGEALFSADGVDWTRHVIAAASNYAMTAVCYHDGKYLAAGTQDLIVISTNGRDWTEVYRSAGGRATACAAGNGTFVVCGFANLLRISTNGTDWEVRVAPQTFRSITFGNGLWVAATGESAVYTSSNLLEWTRVETGFPGFAYLPQVTFGNGVFVVGGAYQPDQGSVSYGTILRVSTNAMQWTQILELPSFGHVQDITYGAGQFLALRRQGYVHSADGFAWQGSTTLDFYGGGNAVAVSDGGRFVAVGTGGEIVRSDDGINWQRVTVESPLINLSALSAAKGRFVAVGAYPLGSFGVGQQIGILNSTNGMDWQPVRFGPNGALNGVAYGNRRWMAVGYGGRVFTSRDAVVWSDTPTVNNFVGLAFGRGRFISFDPNRDAGYVSARGTRWREFRMPHRSDVGNPKFVHGRFVALGGGEDGVILFSRNGVHWRKTTLPGTGWLSGAAHGNGRYVVAGFKVSAISRGGVNWTTHPVPKMVTDLEFVNGWFVGVGSDGVVLSRDGEEWEVQPGPSNLYLLATDGKTLVGTQGTTLYHGSFTNAGLSELLQR